MLTYYNGFEQSSEENTEKLSFFNRIRNVRVDYADITA